jgi:hypothetical protein
MARLVARRRIGLEQLERRAGKLHKLPLGGLGVSCVDMVRYDLRGPLKSRVNPKAYRNRGLPATSTLKDFSMSLFSAVEMAPATPSWV